MRSCCGCATAVRGLPSCCCDRAAGRRIGCPLLFLWAAKDDLEDLYGDPLAVWRDWADDVRGQSLDCGHHLAEEAPEELAALLTAFFAPA